MRELAFLHCHGADLRQAREWCRRYLFTRDLADINQAWELYYSVFKDIQKQIPQLKTVHLRSASSWLFNARNLELAIPGARSSLLQYRRGLKPLRALAMASVDNNTDTAEIIRSGNDLSTTNIESEDEILSVDPFSTDEAVGGFCELQES